MAMTFVFQVFLLKSNLGVLACINTSYGMTFINKNWLLWQFFDQKIKEMSTFFQISEIKVSKHKFTQFAKFSIFFLDKKNKKQKIYTSVKYKFHLIESFRANILSGNNIFALKNFVLNIGLSHIVVKSYEVKIAIRVEQKSQFLINKLLAERDGVIPLYSEAIISLLLISFLNNKDFSFYPIT